MIAVITEWSIYFANKVVAGYAGEVLEDVTLEQPDDIDVWEIRDKRPSHVLAVSATNPKHFKRFKYEWELAGSGFVPTGKNYGELFDVYRGDNGA